MAPNFTALLTEMEAGCGARNFLSLRRMTGLSSASAAMAEAAAEEAAEAAAAGAEAKAAAA